LRKFIKESILQKYLAKNFWNFRSGLGISSEDSMYEYSEDKIAEMGRKDPKKG